MREPFDEAALTAYALGELSAPERERIEALLAGSPETRQERAEIQQTTATLPKALAAAAPEALDPKSRATVEAEAEHTFAPRAQKRWSSIAAALASAAVASFILLVYTTPILRRDAAVARRSLSVPPPTTMP